jgi:hypothetical protein
VTSSGRSRRTPRRGLVVGIALAVAAAVWLVVALMNNSWESAFLAALIVVTVLLGLRSRPFELGFEVGHGERHLVIFRYNKFWGNLAVTVDGRAAVRDVRLFSVKLTKTYRFRVGSAEVHDVRIEKDRKTLLAGVRAQPVRAYVDDVLAAEGTA